MLQRAASNACSWWWASHIRTKQSKWLEQSLQDMEDKVQSMLKLIEEDGDSFAKRAEMYYKRRPELISSVEESYRAFRALADRYDLLSKELQNANHTIATVFPEQVQFAMDEEDIECPTPKPKNSQVVPPVNTANVPKVPKAPLDDLKGLISTASKKFKVKKSSKVEKSTHSSKPVVKSGLSKDEALEQIDKFQKEILALQTVKEFVKSSYENGLAKYWEFENQIMEMQEKVCRLQDEFDVEMVIEDNEARTLMAEAALKSCQETLTLLEEKQQKSTLEAKEEFKKIESARSILESLRQECMKGQPDEQKPHEDGKSANTEIPSKDVSKEIEKGEKRPKVNSTAQSSPSLTVTELAEKIDELVNKVINLETAVSSQTVLINTLRTESDDLHAQIRSLEDEKETLIDDTHNLSARVKEMEEKLKRLEALNKNVESHNSSLQTNFAEARSSLDHLSEKLSSVKPDEESEEPVEESEEPIEEIEKPVLSKEDIEIGKEDVILPCDKEDVKEVDVNVKGSEVLSVPEKEEEKKPVKKSVTFLEPEKKEEVPVNVDHECDANVVNGEGEGEKLKEEELDWQKMLLNVSDDREKILLKEYTTILRNYKEMKQKLSDTEKNSRDSQFDITVQMRDLQRSIHQKDQEIHQLRQKLNSDDPNETFEDILPNEDNEIKLVFMDDTFAISAIEEKLRKDIDAIVDENLNFWLRFSTAFHQVQKFKSETQDLTDEILKLNDKKKNENGLITTQLKSEARPIYKHLREIQTELTVWLEQSVTLKEELKRRSSTFLNVQEEITKSLKEGIDEEDIKFTSHQAARLQGEILNMKQENNKVRNELEAGIDQISGLQVEIDKTLEKLNEEFEISSDQPQLQHNMSRAKVPLRSFIFGTKVKKPRHSIFSFMHPNRKYHVVRTGGAQRRSE